MAKRHIVKVTDNRDGKHETLIFTFKNYKLAVEFWGQVYDEYETVTWPKPENIVIYNNVEDAVSCVESFFGEMSHER